jgi:hypothetical protein
MPDDVSDYESSMRQYSGAEQNERKLAKGMTGKTESARADMWHSKMQEAAKAGMDARRKRRSKKQKSKSASKY